VQLEVVQDFLGSEANATLLRIVTRNAKGISGYTRFLDEKDVLLGPVTKLRVENNALPHVTLHIVHLVEVYDDSKESLSTDMSFMELLSLWSYIFQIDFWKKISLRICM